MKSKVITSAICGILFAIPTYFIVKIFYDDALLLSAFSALLFYLLMLPSLYIIERYTNKRYREAEKAIISPIWYQLNGNVSTPQGVRNANIYFTDGGIVFISMDKKPYVLENVFLQNICKYEFPNIAKLNIYTNDNRMFSVTSSEIKNLFPILKDHGWIK